MEWRDTKDDPPCEDETKACSFKLDVIGCTQEKKRRCPIVDYGR